MFYCQNCGKSVPFAGKVCHWCGAEKRQNNMIALAVFGGLAAFIGISLWTQSLAVGACAVFVIACAAAFIATVMKHNKDHEEKDYEEAD